MDVPTQPAAASDAPLDLSRWTSPQAVALLRKDTAFAGRLIRDLRAQGYDVPLTNLDRWQRQVLLGHSSAPRTPETERLLRLLRYTRDTGYTDEAFLAAALFDTSGGVTLLLLECALERVPIDGSARMTVLAHAHMVRVSGAIIQERLAQHGRTGIHDLRRDITGLLPAVLALAEALAQLPQESPTGDLLPPEQLAVDLFRQAMQVHQLLRAQEQGLEALAASFGILMEQATTQLRAVMTDVLDGAEPALATTDHHA